MGGRAPCRARPACPRLPWLQVEPSSPTRAQCPGVSCEPPSHPGESQSWNLAPAPSDPKVQVPPLGGCRAPLARHPQTAWAGVRATKGLPRRQYGGSPDKAAPLCLGHLPRHPSFRAPSLVTPQGRERPSGRSPPPAHGGMVLCGRAWIP